MDARNEIMAETSEKDRIIQELQKDNLKLRRVNEDLQQCEEKYISIFNQNRDGIVLIEILLYFLKLSCWYSSY